MEIGVYTFGDVADGSAASAARRLGELLEEIALADRVGLDVYGVGEHHRADYAVSAPAVVLAAAAARTRNIRLTSAVTVLSSDDPVRVFQQFATLDLLSGGRAEITVGRGSFIHGLETLEIAREMDIKAHSVQNLFNSMYVKTGCSSRRQLGEWYVRIYGPLSDVIPSE